MSNWPELLILASRLGSSKCLEYGWMEPWARCNSLWHRRPRPKRPWILLAAIKEFICTEYFEMQALVREILSQLIFRVVPVNVSTEPEARITAFDDVKEYIDNAEKRAITPCVSRIIDGSCRKPLMVCLAV